MLRYPSSIDMAHGKCVQPELVTSASDSVWNEACPNEHRPQMLGIVVVLMVVHLLDWTQPERERGKFEEALAEPIGHIDHAKSPWCRDASQMGQHHFRLR